MKLATVMFGVCLLLAAAPSLASEPERRQHADSKAKADQAQRESTKAGEASERAANRGNGFEARREAQKAVDAMDRAEQHNKEAERNRSPKKDPQ